MEGVEEEEREGGGGEAVVGSGGGWRRAARECEASGQQVQHTQLATQLGGRVHQTTTPVTSLLALFTGNDAADGSMHSVPEDDGING